ncbi:MAG: NUDIX hydrolase [Solirubrobacterales bacterium]
MARRTLQDGESERGHDVSAAGGVVLRRDRDGPARVAVIHRPKYMDWSLPKGKLEEGEGFEEAALREVKEEIGFTARLLEELPPVSYLDRKGRTKLVRYWLMEPLEGEFSPHDEVNELRWLTRREAADLLTYDHDRELVGEAMRPGWFERLRRRGG